MAADTVTVDVEGRRLRLSNLDKVLYPQAGFTKGEVIHYYTRIAPVMLPHLRGRPLTLRRFPDGTGAAPFYDKDASRHAPPWLPVAWLPTPGSATAHEQIGYAVIDGLAALVWAANLAGLELHVPQWTVTEAGVPRTPDLLVFDLDPGAGVGIVECARVAEAVREMTAEDGLRCVVKTSGAKGLQVYAPVRVDDAAATSSYAKRVAERLAAERPREVVARMGKDARRGRVFVDWSQNNTAKTTVAPYSLRGGDRPTVSTPLTWPELAAGRRPEDLVFTAEDVLDRVHRHGDLFRSLHETPDADRPQVPVR